MPVAWPVLPPVRAIPRHSGGVGYDAGTSRPPRQSRSRFLSRPSRSFIHERRPPGGGGCSVAEHGRDRCRGPDPSDRSSPTSAHRSQAEGARGTPASRRPPAESATPSSSTASDDQRHADSTRSVLIGSNVDCVASQPGAGLSASNLTLAVADSGGRGSCRACPGGSAGAAPSRIQHCPPIGAFVGERCPPDFPLDGSD